MAGSTARSYGILYLVCCDQSGLHKIGITNNWAQRRRQLRVGETTTQVHVVRVNKAEQLERYLHRRFSAKRLPQSEWFKLDSADLVFVRSVFLKAGSDYKAGGHKSPEVEPPPPPPPPVRPGPPTAAQVKDSGIPEGWSDQQARAAAYRHASRSKGQDTQAAEQEPQPKPNPEAPSTKDGFTEKDLNFARVIISIGFFGLIGIGTVNALLQWAEQKQTQMPPTPTKEVAQPPKQEPALTQEELAALLELRNQGPPLAEQTEQTTPKETPIQAMERRRAEAEALRQAQAAERQAELERIRADAERKEQAKFEKAQAYRRSQCVAPGSTSYDLRCAEANRIVIAGRNKQYQRRKQEAEAYFNDPNSPVPAPKTTPPAAPLTVPSKRTSLPPLPVFPSP